MRANKLNLRVEELEARDVPAVFVPILSPCTALIVPRIFQNAAAAVATPDHARATVFPILVPDAVTVSTPDHTHAPAAFIATPDHGLARTARAEMRVPAEVEMRAPAPAARIMPILIIDAVFASAGGGATAGFVTMPPPRPGLLLPD